MKLSLANTLFVCAITVGTTSGCLKAKSQMPAVSVWRASNEYGDKPGNGIELTARGNEISGRFFILEPEKPRNFDTGRSFTIRILERHVRKFVCEVKFNANQIDKFVLTLPQSFPQDQFVATTHDLEPGTTPIDFVFRRLK